MAPRNELNGKFWVERRKEKTQRGARGPRSSCVYGENKTFHYMKCQKKVRRKLCVDEEETVIYFKVVSLLMQSFKYWYILANFLCCLEQVLSILDAGKSAGAGIRREEARKRRRRAPKTWHLIRMEEEEEEGEISRLCRQTSYQGRKCLSINGTLCFYLNVLKKPISNFNSHFCRWITHLAAVNASICCDVVYGTVHVHLCGRSPIAVR